MSSYTMQKICAWSGMVAVLLFFLGIAVAGFLPLPSPSMAPAAVAAFYQANSGKVLAGFAVVLASGMFMAPMVGVISQQMDRMTGVPSALSYAQIAAGACGIMFFFLAPIFFILAAYRPERAPELTYLMNDAAWIFLVLPWPPAFMENLVIGIAILMDRGAVKLFPRWLAWMNFLVALVFTPATILIFVKSGPFAWNGMFGFWLPGSAFGIWFVTMTWGLLRAIAQEERAAGR